MTREERCSGVKVKEIRVYGRKEGREGRKEESMLEICSTRRRCRERLEVRESQEKSRTGRR